MPARSGVSQATGNSWMSQEYVLDYFWWPNQTQPSQMLFRVFGEDRIKQWHLQLNDEVKINFHIEAHEYDSRWFNEVRCTNVQKVGASAQQPAQPSNEQQMDNNPQPQQNTPTGEGNAEGGGDDLPF